MGGVPTIRLGREELGLSAIGNTFVLGAFDVTPQLNQISAGTTKFQVEPLIMEVLLILVAQQGKLVSREEFMQRVWPNENASDEVLTRAISILRKTFKSIEQKTAYIETIPRYGYSLNSDLKCDALPDKKVSKPNEGQTFVRKKAHALYLQARSLMERPFIDGALPNAISYLEEAVILDEKFSEAHATLGEAYSQLATYSIEIDKPDLVKRAAASAEDAVKLNPKLGFPLTLIAMHRFSLGDIVGALDLSFKAFDLTPDDPEVALRLGYFLAIIGRTKQSIPFYEMAVAENPARGRNLQSLAQAKLCNGDLGEAEVLAKRAIDLQHLFAHDTYAAVAYAKGKYELASQRFTDGCYAMYHMFGEEFSDPEKWKQYSGLIFSRDPNIRARVAIWLRDLCERPGEPPSIPLLTGLVRTGSATDLFAVCGDLPPIGAQGALLRIWGNVDTCEMIYRHPDFPNFAKRMGMTEAWQKYGLPDQLD